MTNRIEVVVFYFTLYVLSASNLSEIGYKVHEL